MCMNDLRFLEWQSLWWLELCQLQIVHPLKLMKQNIISNLAQKQWGLKSQEFHCLIISFLPLSMLKSPRNLRSLLLFVTSTLMISGGLFWFATNNYQLRENRSWLKLDRLIKEEKYPNIFLHYLPWTHERFPAALSLDPEMDEPKFIVEYKYKRFL